MQPSPHLRRSIYRRDGKENCPAVILNPYTRLTPNSFTGQPLGSSKNRKPPWMQRRMFFCVYFSMEKIWRR